MILPERIAGESESSQQKALFCWTNLPDTRRDYPELRWFHAIPNGGKRDAITANNLKLEGVKAGVPDTFLPVPRQGYHGLFIEMKKPAKKPVRAGSAGGVSAEQMEFRDFVKDQGFCWVVCYTWEEARQTLIEYLV